MDQVLWIRNSTDVLMTGLGGHACAFPSNGTYPVGQGYAPFAPTLLRLEGRNDRISLANLWTECVLDQFVIVQQLSDFCF